MPFPAGVNFSKMELFFKGADKVWSNVLWFTTLSAFPGSFNLSTFALYAESQLASFFCDCMVSTVNYIGMNCLVHNAGLARSIDTYTVTPGTQTGGTGVPDDVAFVVSRLTATAGKSGRGRIYVSGVPSTFITENRLNSSSTATVAALATQLKAPIINQLMTWSPANYSHLLSAFHAATDFVPEPLLGTQRRRKARR